MEKDRSPLDENRSHLFLHSTLNFHPLQPSPSNFAPHGTQKQSRSAIVDKKMIHMYHNIEHKFSWLEPIHRPVDPIKFIVRAGLSR